MLSSARLSRFTRNSVLAFWKLSTKKRRLKKEYVADVVCYGQIIVEIKALDRLSGKEESQILNYLKATGLRVGVLINFGSSGKLEWKRYVR